MANWQQFGIDIQSQNPSTGQVAKWNGSQWLPQADSGKIVQIRREVQSGVLSTTGNMVWDNTTPTTSDGSEWERISNFQRESSTSDILILSSALYGANSGQEFSTAVFVPSLSSAAFGVAADTVEGSSRIVSLQCWGFVSGSSFGAGSRDITARWGRGGTQTVYINAENGNARFGSALKSQLIAIEVEF